jgi:hypothetical protein
MCLFNAGRSLSAPRTLVSYQGSAVRYRVALLVTCPDL